MSVEVFPVVLRNERVEPFAPFVSGVADEKDVGRRYDDRGNRTDVFGEPFVLLAVAFERLAAVALERAGHRFVAAAVRQILPVEQKELFAVAHALPVGHGKRTFAHRQIPYGVYHVGLAGPVASREAVDARSEFEVGLCYVFEVQQRQFADIHVRTGCVMCNFPSKVAIPAGFMKCVFRYGAGKGRCRENLLQPPSCFFVKRCIFVV